MGGFLEARIITTCYPTHRKIRMSADGFSGIVGTGWGEEFQSWMPYRLGAGRPLADTRGLWRRTVRRATWSVVLVKDRPFYTGLGTLRSDFGYLRASKTEYAMANKTPPQSVSWMANDRV